jgi:hypothetical protein
LASRTGWPLSRDGGRIPNRAIDIFWLDSIVDEGLRGEFPVAFSPSEKARDWEELAAKVEARLKRAAEAAGMVDRPMLTDPFGVKIDQ